MQVRNRKLSGGLGVAVRHPHHDRFLQPEHVAQVVIDGERVHERQLGGPGITEQHLDAFLLQELQECAFSRHDGQGCPPRFLLNAPKSYFRNRYLCSPVSTSSLFWLWMVAPITTMPVVRCGIRPVIVSVA